jgi:uncharacterized protein DUF4158
MASGSYFPPPVQQVEIPKKQGGVRTLGVPTVANRIGQQVVKARIEGELEGLFHPDSYGYRLNKSAADAVAVTRAHTAPHRPYRDSSKGEPMDEQPRVSVGSLLQPARGAARMSRKLAVFLGRHTFPAELTDFELRQTFTFDAEERENIRQAFRSLLRIGAALQLSLLRLTGTTSNSIQYVPSAVLLHLGSQFGCRHPT